MDKYSTSEGTYIAHGSVADKPDHIVVDIPQTQKAYSMSVNICDTMWFISCHSVQVETFHHLGFSQRPGNQSLYLISPGTIAGTCEGVIPSSQEYLPIMYALAYILLTTNMIISTNRVEVTMKNGLLLLSGLMKSALTPGGGRNTGTLE